MTVVQRSHRMTVEEAWRAKQKAAGAEPRPGTSPEPVVFEPEPGGDGPGVARVESADAKPQPMISVSGPATAPTTAARPRMPITPVSYPPEVRLPARPRIEPEPAILGLSRHTRSRLGSRLFNLFFLLVFGLIVVQMVVALLRP